MLTMYYELLFLTCSKSETLTSIRIVKFFGLESAFAAKIREKREKELALCLKSVMYNLSFHTSMVFGPR